MADSGSYPLLQDAAENTASQLEALDPSLAAHLRELARKLRDGAASGERRAVVDALVQAVKEAGRKLGRGR